MQMTDRYQTVKVRVDYNMTQDDIGLMLMRALRLTFIVVQDPNLTQRILQALTRLSNGHVYDAWKDELYSLKTFLAIDVRRPNGVNGDDDERSKSQALLTTFASCTDRIIKHTPRGT
jgi:hypothetical protein